MPPHLGALFLEAGMKYALFAGFIVAIAMLGTTQAQVIQVLDRHTHQPVVNAHILSTQGKVFTTTDVDGKFQLKEVPEEVFIIRAIGYELLEVDKMNTPTSVMLTPIIMDMGMELIVKGESQHSTSIHAYHQQNTSQTMDEFLQDVDGVSMIQRGAFAWEPSVRGQADQRMNLTIDGVPIFKACVDKMDPITSYVENNNLAKLQIDKNGSRVAEFGSGNALVNLVTKKAEWSATEIDLETSFQAPNHLQVYRMNVNTSDKSNKNALRLSGAYRKADDLVAGGNERIENTQFEKFNVNLNYRHAFNETYSMEANYITDKAYDVGYPALLMDATSALADIGRLQLNIDSRNYGANIHSVMVFANKIRHSMDDYNRDVANRTVMRGMYMPMYGETFTYGAKISGDLRLVQQPTTWYTEVFSSNAYGDMLMQNLDPTIADMLIYNMDDVNTRQLSLGLKQRFQPSSSTSLNIEASIRYKQVKTSSNSHASLFEGIYNRSYTPSRALLLAGSGSLLWMINDQLSLTNSLVYSERMGNHMELLGHYVYNYTDGYFYDGNPWLDKERTLNYELHTMWKNDYHSVSVSVFGKYYNNYIDGIVSDEISSVDFQFKRNANVGNVIMAGGEVRIINSIHPNFTLEHRISHLYAQNLTLKEALPLIPPLHGISTLEFHHSATSLSLDVDWATAQHRIASQTSIEDSTPGFLVFGINAKQHWLNHRLTTTLAVHNITDKYYHRHTSIGNIPEQGFNVMLTLNYSFGIK